MRLTAGVLIASILLAAGPVHAQTADSSATASADTTSRIGLNLVYDGELVTNASGGIETGSAFVGNLHLELTVSLERLIGWSGATLFLAGLGTHGGQPSNLVGDAQGVSNLEAPGGVQLYEAWVQQNGPGGRLSALIGRYDLNTEFYVLQSATLFLNSSFGIGPEFSLSGRGGPSIFPDPAVGARLEAKPRSDVVLRAAVLDGVPVHRPDENDIFAEGDGLLLVGESTFLNRPSPSERRMRPRFRIGRGAALAPYEHKFAVGGWYYTGTFDDLSETSADGGPVHHQGSGGAYFLGDGLLHRSSSRPSRQLSGFVQLGLGDSRVNRFGTYVGGGLVLSDLFPQLDNDELGFAFATAHNGDHYLDAARASGISVTDTERTFELTYLFQTTDHTSVQPDLQYVRHPGTDPSISHAFVVGVHFEVAY
jgi:porin